MKFAGVVLLIAYGCWPDIGAAQGAVDTEKIASMMVRLCVGGGHTEVISGGATGGAEMSLRSLDVTGNLKGEFNIKTSNAEGLVDGINGALSQVSADQADKVRACLQPFVRRPILDKSFHKPLLNDITSMFDTDAAEMYFRGLEKVENAIYMRNNSWHFHGYFLISFDGCSTPPPASN